MKVLGILGSPHRKIGNTYLLMESMFEELEREGVETEIVLLPNLNIKYCTGCATCLSLGECPQKDDAIEIKNKMLEVDGIVFGSPVYFLSVTAQMKTFIDRCLSFGHRPSLFGKYGASVSVYAGVGDVDAVADYMNGVLQSFGVVTVGKVCGLATKPGDLKRNDLLRAKDLGRELFKAMRDKKVYPIRFSKAMRNLILREKDFLKVDYKYWKEKGWLEEVI